MNNEQTNNDELVTPVEELALYSVGETTDYFLVEDKDGKEISCFWKDSHPNPQAAAVAERDRMNAEVLKNATETKKHLLTINTMNTEQQNKDARFYLEELKFGGFAICDHCLPDDLDEVCLYRPQHPYARKAAEDELDRLKAWHRGSGQIATPRRGERPPVGIVKGQFFKREPELLSVAEKRRYLAEIFRSSEFTDADKFKALQEDNRMLAMFGPEKGKEQSDA